MKKNDGTGLAATAFAIYLIGGAGTFAGLALILFMNGRSIGYLLLCIGLCLSIAGVLFMRIFRSRLIG